MKALFSPALACKERYPSPVWYPGSACGQPETKGLFFFIDNFTQSLNGKTGNVFKKDKCVFAGITRLFQTAQRLTGEIINLEIRLILEGAEPRAIERCFFFFVLSNITSQTGFTVFFTFGRFTGKIYWLDTVCALFNPQMLVVL